MNAEDQLMALFATEREPYEWAGRGELMIKRCGECARTVSADKYVCADCGSARLVGEAASGRGTIYAVTSIPNRAGGEPAVVVLVDLVEGPRLIGRLHPSDGVIAQQAAIGAPVSVVFEPVAENLGIPGWVLASDKGAL